MAPRAILRFPPALETTRPSAARKWLLRSLAPTVALAVAASTVRADEPVALIVSVGKDGLTAAEVSADFGRLGPARRRALGETPSLAIRAFVATEVVPRLLLSEHAKQSLPGSARTIDLALARSMLESMARDVPPPDMTDVTAYYSANLREFQEPASLRLWQIVVSDRELARRIIAESTGAKGPERWRNFAKEHSKDDATKYRAGDLGFVYEDGQTLVPALRVAPELFRAAAAVPDGSIVPEPIPRGDQWVVLWRRGSRQATNVGKMTAKEGIERALRHERFARERDALLEALRKKHVSELHPELLEHVPFDEVEVTPPIASPKSVPPSGSSFAPVPTERGLR